MPPICRHAARRDIICRLEETLNETTPNAALHHFFGSSETERKLHCLREYLKYYSIALQKQNFARIYIDAFAGTGNRTETRAALPFMENGVEVLEEVSTPGSARIALETEPRFHANVFIEQDPAKVAALKAVLAEYPDCRAQIREGDANDIVQALCARYRWQQERIRGVIFLDPYGMEVSWKTVEAIARTEALDCWYFFPLSGLYRNAPHDPLDLDDGKSEALTRVFGTDRWRQEWYAMEAQSHQIDLWGNQIPSKERRVATVDVIEKWVHDHLSSTFRGSVLPPLRLRHKNGAPMASLFFAVSNPSKAANKLARQIAGHILKAGISSQVRPR
ncbi:three-Cys-motif partner protein TcmP [Shinella sp. CPCC 100929]|uniref:Three-Cys-motif partner protein TcmP n=1 Tax=Shinella lacus TaxID=2654216 RepID=A0ABT1R912_9HYPH|nr:three-Cys-motif partner protein TcmP [Shinella lacus]